MRTAITTGYRVLILAACALLAACSSNFSKPVAYAYTTLTAVQDATAGALRAGTIEVQDARRILDISECVDGVLDRARAIWEAGQTIEAQRQLAVALTVIAELQSLQAGGSFNVESCGA